jgi:hypothetical protein
MSDTNSRHKTVELLWQLKQQAERNQVNGVSFIHFNLMLRDADYRNGIIEKACSCGDEALRALGKQLSELNIDEALLLPGGNQESAAMSGKTRGRNASDAEKGISQAASPGQSAKPFRLVAMLCLVLVIAAAGYGVVSLPSLQGSRHISESITEDTVWPAGSSYLLEGLVYVENGASLTIEEGVTVRGQKGSALIVTRDSQLYAKGTAQAPIVFTSGQKPGTRRSGDWGGLVLLGNARVNKSNAFIEGVPVNDTRGYFGGDDDADSCGVLTYVRIEFAGHEVYANNELNGLTLAGCGSNTIVRNLQVHRALDDGIEVFGGAVDLKYAVVSGAGDDGFDWDMGWRGRVQYLLVQQHENVGDNGFEGDNSKSNPDAQPRSAPQFYNVTLISPHSGGKAQRAMTLRAGTGGSFHNMIIEGFSAEAIDLRDAVAPLLAEGSLELSHMYLAGIGPGGNLFYADESANKDDDNGFDEQAFFMADQQHMHHQQQAALLKIATDPLQPNFTPPRYRLLEDTYAAIPQGEFWNESAQYLGAIRPGSKQSWLDHWTDFPAN